MFQPIVNRLQDVENAFRTRTGYSFWIELRLNDSPFEPIKLWSMISSESGIEMPEGLLNNKDLESFDDVLAALDSIEHWISTLPDHETVEKQNAVRNLGQALDQCKDAGIDTEPFDEPFRNIYDNLLPAC